MSLRPACATPRCPNRAAPGSSRCEDCQPLGRSSYRKDPKLKAIYNSARWQAVRSIKLQRDPVCEWCQEAPAVDVHHIKALAEGGKPFSMENLMSGCKPCHTRHELEERKRKRSPTLKHRAPL